MDSEVFPSYIDALRNISLENRILKRCGYKVSHFRSKYRPEYGRCEMFKILAQKGAFSEEIVISRISTNGFH